MAENKFSFWWNKPKYVTVMPRQAEKREIPEGLWTKCPDCSELLYNKELERNLHVCNKCGHHFRMGAMERLNMLTDPGSFKPYEELEAKDPLGFVSYKEKLLKSRAKSKLKDAIITGEATIEGYPAVIGVMDYNFMLGSMGSVVGEQVARAVERAIEKRLPLVIVCASGGGARMQEGMLSLMQMAKTSAALARLDEAGLFYLSILTDATMAGVLASFASLGDIILAEPGAMIGFAGPRVIEQTIREKLPAGSHTAEFAFQHGLVDRIVQRKDLKATVGKLLAFHQPKGGES
ncbi:MAG: acetyl-CoA carboxylase carboxyltransferase subunit beta [Firmicutes bacterium]|jgi:acetyl-CoA carboxylase carboxyl transferase subunit beta|nr:acetyl-CoA carboxylase carboxyltransferase subunit beta [Bacillota bacterium]HOB21618.1 acetyl-CoA carboxylase, carboxyltransferase subunit beta [Bacillota bacterium]HQD39071.1 acetyl-CoA carboxylase, carboxyltransferase subunit beta [Bacillota bacterium]